MSANTTPIFTLTPVMGWTQISTANTNRDGTGTTGSMIAGNTNGTRISRIRIQSSGSQVNNGMVRIFVQLPSASPVMLYDEVAVPATVVSASAVGFDYTIEYLGERALVLPSTAKLLASTTTTDPFNVFAEGGDY
jgi:hypothetical protein